MFLTLLKKGGESSSFLKMNRTATQGLD